MVGGGDDCWSAAGGGGNSPLLQAWGFALIGAGGPGGDLNIPNNVDLSSDRQLLRKASFHMGVTRDLFGSGISSNAAESFSSGLKGRFNEARLTGDDHERQDATYDVARVVNGQLVVAPVPAPGGGTVPCPRGGAPCSAAQPLRLSRA